MTSPDVKEAWCHGGICGMSMEQAAHLSRRDLIALHEESGRMRGHSTKSALLALETDGWSWVTPVGVPPNYTARIFAKCPGCQAREKGWFIKGEVVSLVDRFEAYEQECFVVDWARLLPSGARDGCLIGFVLEEWEANPLRCIIGTVDELRVRLAERARELYKDSGPEVEEHGIFIQGSGSQVVGRSVRFEPHARQLGAGSNVIWMNAQDAARAQSGVTIQVPDDAEQSRARVFDQEGNEIPCSFNFDEDRAVITVEDVMDFIKKDWAEDPLVAEKEAPNEAAPVYDEVWDTSSPPSPSTSPSEPLGSEVSPPGTDPATTED